MTSTMTRREVLRLLGVMAAALSTAPLAEAAGAACPSWIAGVDLEGLHSLARDYTTSYGDAAGVDQVDTLLNQDESQAGAEIRRMSVADYEAGRLVRVGGWHVSRTEGRLFAALAARC